MSIKFMPMLYSMELFASLVLSRFRRACISYPNFAKTAKNLWEYFLLYLIYLSSVNWSFLSPDYLRGIQGFTYRKEDPPSTRNQLFGVWFGS